MVFIICELPLLDVVENRVWCSFVTIFLTYSEISWESWTVFGGWKCFLCHEGQSFTVQYVLRLTDWGSVGRNYSSKVRYLSSLKQ